MPSSDYTAATGGALKFKGSNIAKKKKKKPKLAPKVEAPKDSSATPDADKAVAESSTESTLSKNLRDEDESLRQEIEKDIKQYGRNKTEAERRFEEQRRKRLDERLKKDGVKTHKERVEELNRYLSKLSEHHDMYVVVVRLCLDARVLTLCRPKIGPG